MALDFGFFGGSDLFGGRSAPGVGEGLFSAEGSFGGGGQDIGLFPQRKDPGRPFEKSPNVPPVFVDLQDPRLLRGLTPEDQVQARPEERFGQLNRNLFLMFLEIFRRVGLTPAPPDKIREGFEFKGPRFPDFSIQKPLPRLPGAPLPSESPKSEGRKPLRREFF